MKEIYEEFGPCIDFIEENPSLEQRCALWAETNILLVSTLRDGLCLLPIEYTIVKKLIGKMSDAVMVLSEFSGCNKAFTGYIEYNPFNYSDLVKKLGTAINMHPKEKEELLSMAYNYASKFTLTQWVELFLKDLKFSYLPS